MYPLTKTLLLFLLMVSFTIRGQQDCKNQILSKLNTYKNAIAPPLSDSLWKAYTDIISVYKSKQPDSALFFANKALILAQNFNNKDKIRDMLAIRGDIYLFSGWGRNSWWLAFDSYSMASKMAWEKKDRLAFAKILNSLAICYISQNGAGEYTEKNLFYGALSEEATFNSGFIFPKTFLLPDSSDSKPSTKTILQFINTINKSVQYFKKMGQKKEIMYRLHRLANLQLMNKINIDEAENNIQKAIQLANDLKEYEFEIVIYLTTAHNFYHLLHNIEKQKQYAQQGYDLAEKHHSMIKKALLSDQLYYYYKDTKQYQKALSYKEFNIHIMDSLNLIGDKEKSVLLKEKTDLQLQELNIQRKLENQKQTQIMLIIGIVFLLLISVAIFVYNKILKNKNQELTIKNQEISEAMLRGQTFERKRVASELHDNLGSNISSIRWAFQAINQSKWSDDEKEIFTNVQTMFDKVYDDVRLLAHNLLPEEFERIGLLSALQDLIKKMNKNPNVNFIFHYPENFARLSKRVEFELYSIILEVINNIIRHAEATQVLIIFEQNKQSLTMSIKDNGKGFDLRTAKGYGLKNLQYRAESIDAKLVINSTQVGGTNITLEL